jgi:two-component system cell cycle sensor histidine kinase/response regulator CckA
MSPVTQTETVQLLREVGILHARLGESEHVEHPSAPGQLLELEYVYAAAPVGLLMVDRELRYVRINERLASMNGKPVAAHIGRTLREVIPDKAHLLEPLYRKVLDTGIEVSGYEISIPSSQGKLLRYLATYYPLRSASGEIIGVCGAIQDVTAERAAESRLRESESRYRFLAESLPVFVWTVDSEGRVGYMNRHLTAYTGLSPESAGSGAWNTVVHPDDLPTVSRTIEGALADRRDCEIEFRIRRASDGAYRWFLAKATSSQVADGAWRWLGVAFDIEDRKRTEHTRALLASIVESSSDAIVGLDCESRIIIWNPAAKELFGYAEEEVTGRTYLSVVLAETASGKTVLGKTEDQERETMMRVLAGERVEQYESFFVNPAGACPASDAATGRELSLFVVTAPIRDTAGRVTGAFKTIRDLTRQRQTERELSRAGERLSVVQRAVNAGTWEIDTRTGLIYPSAELVELFGGSATAHGRIEDWLSMMHPEDRDRVHRAVREAVRSRRELRIQFRIIRKGEVRWVTALGSAVGSEGERMMGITIDTTEIQKAEEVVRQTARLESIGRLAGGVAHDFNNLLAGILGGASFIDETLPEDHPGRAMLEVVIRSSERAAHLTNQLLAYAGKASFTLRCVDLSKIVQDAAPLLSGSISARVELVVQTGWDLPLIEADANQVRETVLNLVTNASEAIGDRHGSIRIRTGVERLDRPAVLERFGNELLSPGRFVYLEVCDSGEGMNPEVRRRIFEPFYTTKFTGRGLGLSAVEGIVRAHHGAIEVLSEPGRGSTFRIFYPVSAREVDAAAQVEAGRGARLVLVIDDEEAVRNIVRAALARDGYSVIAAADGITGLELLRQHRDQVSLVILDIGMPGMGGPEVYEQFMREGITVPVLITSGYSEDEAMRRIPGVHTSCFIQKPFSVQDLSALIGRLIGDPKPAERSAGC